MMSDICELSRDIILKYIWDDLVFKAIENLMGNTNINEILTNQKNQTPKKYKKKIVLLLTLIVQS